MEHGIPPQPYLRPAIYEIVNNPDVLKDILLRKYNGGVYGVCTEIVTRAIELLNEHNTPYTGAIVNEMHVEYSENGDSGDAVFETMSPEIWNGYGKDHWSDFKGEYRPNHYNGGKV